MASGLILDYIRFGTIGARPVAPDLHTGALGLYWATDEDKLYSWDGAWAEVAPPGAAPAFNDLTDVTITAPASGQIIEYDGAGWVNVTPAAAVGAVVTEATAARTALPAAAGEYTRFTLAAVKAYTFDSAQTYVAGTEFSGRNVGAGDLTLTAAGTFVLNPPADGTLVVPQDGTFTVKIVTATEGDVAGYTVAFEPVALVAPLFTGAVLPSVTYSGGVSGLESMTMSSNTWRLPWSDQSWADGAGLKIYGEIILTVTGSATDIIVGFVQNPTLNNVIYHAAGTAGMYYTNGGQVLPCQGGGNTSSASGWVVGHADGERIGFAFDIDDRRFWFRRGDTGAWLLGGDPDDAGAGFTWDATPLSNIPAGGTWHMAAGGWPQNTTLTFAQTNLYPPPTGFTALAPLAP